MNRPSLCPLTFYKYLSFFQRPQEIPTTIHNTKDNKILIHAIGLLIFVLTFCFSIILLISSSSPTTAVCWRLICSIRVSQSRIWKRDFSLISDKNHFMYRRKNQKQSRFMELDNFSIVWINISNMRLLLMVNDF